MNWTATALLTLALSTCAFAQSTGGVAGISGVVKDPSGAAVPNAKVVISSASQGTLRSIQTNGAGAFAAPALLPGPGYKVAVTAAGFAPFELNDIDLEVGQSLSLNVPLTVGQTSTTIDVVGAAELLDDTKSDVSTVVSGRQIADLPVNGRRVDSFVLLTPGVSNDATFGLLTFRGVAGNNSFLIDGNDNTEQFYDENAGRTRIQSQISQDAVQEFQVVSDNYSAEYGRAMGGVVNTVTKSGTNQLHGTAFYYFRSTGFDAADPFATINETNSAGVTTPTRINPPEKQVEGGATIGGALIKDKLFWLVNADLEYRKFPLVDSYISSGVINPATQSWVTTGSQACGAPATAAQCNAINGLLPRFFGLVPRTDDNDLAFGRLDYHPNDKNTFTAEFNFLRWWSPNGIQTGLSSTSGAGITGNGDDSVRVRNGKLGWTWVPSSNLVNNFHFGVDTDRQADSFDAAELGSGLGYLDVSVDGVQLGPATYLPRVEPSETRYEFSDDATYVKGDHNLKFGFNFFTTEDYNYYISNAFGSYTYANPTCFALDYTPVAGQPADTSCTTGGTGKNWSGYSQTFGNPVADYRINELAWYVNDQWKVSPRFTLGLGVRWDKSLSMNFPVTNPAFPQTGYIHTPSADFSPRVGASYRLNDKMVLRGGFGLFYARLLGSLIDNLWTTNGIYQIPSSFTGSNAAQLAAGPVFPNILPPTTTVVPVSTTTIQYAAPNYKTPYSAQANLTLERQITSDMLLSVSGIMSRGIHLLGAADVNLNPATTTYSVPFQVENSSGQVVGTYTVPLYTTPRPNTAWGTVYEVTNGVDSVYDALAVTLNKRFSHAFQMLGSYTWAHEIDDGQEQASNALFFNSFTSLYNGNNSAERGNGWEDQRHRFVLSLVWAPTVKSDNPFVKWILNDWQFSSITTLASGRPYSSTTVTGSLCTTANTTGCIQLPSGTSLLSTSFPDAFTGVHRVPWLPVNNILTPASYRADIRVTKNIPIKIGDRDTRLALNGEAFNISNSWSPTSMSSAEYVLSKGVLTPNITNGIQGWGVGTADGGFPDGTQARRLQISARYTF
jgi:Carboxypeptidase regulatory-like domain/TonB dependent receptor